MKAHQSRRGNALVCVILTVGFYVTAWAGDNTLRHEAIIEAPIGEVWVAFTTKQGLESWMVAKAEIDLKVGGTMRTRYAADGTLGDPETIENTILSFEPERMISLKATKPPASFLYKTAIERMWTVVSFEALGVHRTRVTCTSMGFGDDEESRKMREHFDVGNKWTMEKLRTKFVRNDSKQGSTDAELKSDARPTANADSATAETQVMSVKRVEKEIVVPASLKQVWEAWTTPEGAMTFFAPHARVELRSGGPYEMLFSKDAPEGSRGSEGCVVLTYRPMELLSFTWNAPPKWPSIRNARTVVVVQFAELEKDRVKVSLTHLGFGEGAEWDEVQEYFVEAWPVVLGRLQDRFAKGPLNWDEVRRAREARADK